jgi:2-iminobutanoate/2-iminopropanoate deaminase
VLHSRQTRYPRLSYAGAQVVTSACNTFPHTLAMPLKPITSDRLAKPVGPFSPAVRDGDRVYTSGQIAQDPATGKLIAGDVAAQTEQVLRNLEAIMSAADKSLADVVKVNVYLADMQHFAAMNEVYAKHFVAPYPARTTVAVAALPLGAAVEMEMIAN